MEVSDSLCIPQYNKDGEERVILFLKMNNNYTFGSGLVKRIRDSIRIALSARHVPALILETKDIPVSIKGINCYSILYRWPDYSDTQPETWTLSFYSIHLFCWNNWLNSCSKERQHHKTLVCGTKDKAEMILENQPEIGPCFCLSINITEATWSQANMVGIFSFGHEGVWEITV